MKPEGVVVVLGLEDAASDARNRSRRALALRRDSSWVNVRIHISSRCVGTNSSRFFESLLVLVEMLLRVLAEALREGSMVFP